MDTITILEDDTLNAVVGGFANNGSGQHNGHNTDAGALPATGDVGNKPGADPLGADLTIGFLVLASALFGAKGSGAI